MSKADGAVKYELVLGRYRQGYGLPLADPEPGVQGVLLVEVRDGRKLKVEIFPGKIAREVEGFTKAAVTYER